MKKIIAISAAILCFAAVASAQPKAIGIRITDGAEISYQHEIGSTFVEGDFGWSHTGVYLTGIYDFVLASIDALSIYAGPGVSIGDYDYDFESGFEIAAVGQGGVEYNFNFPLNLSIDWRPMINFVHDHIDWSGIALGVRYRF